MSANDTGLNRTHIALGFVFAMCIVAVTALEVYFGAQVKALDDFVYMMIAAQDIGIAAFNGYYISNVNLSPQGLQETTQKSP